MVLFRRIYDRLRRGIQGNIVIQFNSSNSPGDDFTRETTFTGFQRGFIPRPKRSKTKYLTSQEVDETLRANEYSYEFSNGPVKSYDSNQINANDPIEDSRAEASCLITKGFLVGIFDGHYGYACSPVLAKRLFHYISACLLPYDQLKEYCSSLSSSKPRELIQSYNDNITLSQELEDMYQKSFRTFLNDLIERGNKPTFEMSSALEEAFLRLDNDLSQEAIPKNGEVNLTALSVAMAGSVACVAHIDGVHLHIANVGDCGAVLGTLSDTNTWISKKLTNEHDIRNKAEVRRILSEHPKNEHATVLREGRLVGCLAPLRAMGDFCFKWSKEIIDSVLIEKLKQNRISRYLHTPPYLSAVPEVLYHHLTPQDKFLVIASDGLWDVLSPTEVVMLVGEHMSGKSVLSKKKLLKLLNSNEMTLGQINQLLIQRKERLKTKPKDLNAATHLIRNALGGAEYGIDNETLSNKLSDHEFPRYYYDDISITVIYFDSEYLRHCSL